MSTSPRGGGDGSSEPLLGGSIGLIGLGNIGACVCKRLICAGYRVKVCEIREEARVMLAKMGADVVSNPAEAGADVPLLIVCVFTFAQVEDVLFGNPDSGEAGAITRLPPGATVCLHTTVSPDQAISFATRLEKTDHHFLDAPIIGGKVGADTGTLTIVASGDDAAIEAATNPLRQVGERFFRCGTTAGAASSVKMIDSMLVGIHTVAAAEAIVFAVRTRSRLRFGAASDQPRAGRCRPSAARRPPRCTTRCSTGWAIRACSKSGSPR